MRVLLTTSRLEHRAGSELYVAELAAWLRDQGHEPVVYAARLGQVADELRAEGIRVVADMDDVGEPPDVIHAQHHLAAMSALATFPLVPAVGFCHGLLPWQEAAVKHPAIRHYVAVSHPTRERVISETGVSPAIVHVVPNFVDLARYDPRGPLPATPGKALVFSNSAKAGVGGWVDGVLAACKAREITVDIVGRASGNPVAKPEAVLPRYDLVFARGRSALEAMAAGVAVIMCDIEGCGPFVTPGEFGRLQDANFGKAILTESHHGSYLGGQIDRYDPSLARASTDIVRSTLDREDVAPRLARIYRESIAAVGRAPHTLGSSREAERAYLGWLDRNYPRPALESVERLDEQYHHFRQLAIRIRDERDRYRAERDQARRERDFARRGRGRELASAQRPRSGYIRFVLPRLRRVRELVAPTGSRRHLLIRAVRETLRPR